MEGRQAVEGEGQEGLPPPLSRSFVTYAQMVANSPPHSPRRGTGTPPLPSSPAPAAFPSIQFLPASSSPPPPPPTPPTPPLPPPPEPQDNNSKISSSDFPPLSQGPYVRSTPTAHDAPRRRSGGGSHPIPVPGLVRRHSGGRRRRRGSGSGSGGGNSRKAQPVERELVPLRTSSQTTPTDTVVEGAGSSQTTQNRPNWQEYVIIEDATEKGKAKGEQKPLHKLNEVSSLVWKAMHESGEKRGHTPEKKAAEQHAKQEGWQYEDIVSGVTSLVKKIITLGVDDEETQHKNGPEASVAVPDHPGRPTTGHEADSSRKRSKSRPREAAPPGTQEYVVQKGDTLAGIAIKFQTSIADIQRLNKNVKPLFPDTVIHLPRPVPSTSRTVSDPAPSHEIGKERDAISPPPQDSTPVPPRQSIRSSLPPVALPPHGSSDPGEVFKAPVMYRTENLHVEGLLTITPLFVIFEPSFDDPVVKERGLQPFSLNIDTSQVVDVSFVEKLIESDGSEHDMTHVEISWTGLESSRVVYFGGDRTSIEGVCRVLREWTASSSGRTEPETMEAEEKDPPCSPPQKIDSPFELVAQEDYVVEDYVDAPRLLSPTAIFARHATQALVRCIPKRFQMMDWVCVYSVERHGQSVNTFYQRVAGKGPSIIAIQDTSGHIFGGFASESWRLEKGYYGTGESFLFTFTPTFQVFPWSRENEYFLLSTEDGIAMGGGDHFGLRIDSDFTFGSTGACATFGSSPLIPREDFKCLYFECWCFQLAKRLVEPEISDEEPV